MKPLIVLLVSFCITVFIIKLVTHDYDIALAARIAMSIMMAFTAIAHFAFAKGMAMMVPSIIPYKLQMVYITGVIEIGAATGLLIPPISILSAWLLIIFFILILPANIKAANDKVDYQKATLHGPGKTYLWFRIPLQVFFIA